MINVTPSMIQMSLCEKYQTELTARPKGFEPPTLGSEDRCSIQLSYGRMVRTVPLSGSVKTTAPTRVLYQ